MHAAQTVKRRTMPRNLDISKRSPEAEQVLATLYRRVVGQEQASHILVDIVENFQAGFTRVGKPAGTVLFLGPTGSGKTHVVESLCKGLFGNERACIKIDCGEFQHSHEIAKLIGSPPGYLGHRETNPMFTQEALNQFHTDSLKLSVVLFDEIEKSSDALWNLMLGIMDKAVLTLGDNRTVDFSKVIIVMTSNLGATEMGDAINGGFGFAAPSTSTSVNDEVLASIAVDAAKRHFTPEFYNRLDHVAVFKTLTEAQIADVLNVELDQAQVRLLFTSKVKVFWNVLPKAKARLVKEGYSPKYGARHLGRAVEKMVIIPLARLVASGQLQDRDSVVINEVGKEEFSFELEEGTL